MIRVKIQLTYRLVPYEIEASDQTDIMYVLGEGFLGKVIERIQDFIDGCFEKAQGA